MQDSGATIHSESLPWLPLAPGVGVRILRFNPDSVGYTVMIRAEPGGVLPRHRHLDEAEIYIVRGSGTHPQTGDFRPGDFICEKKGAVHDALEFTELTELLMVARGPSAFLAPDGSDMFFMDIPMLQGLSQSAAGHGR